MSLSIAGVLALSATTRAYGMISWEYAAALVLILAVLAIVAHLTVRVTLASDDVPDLPSTKFPKFETRSSPPPLDPTFRGSSGPPPERKD